MRSAIFSGRQKRFCAPVCRGPLWLLAGFLALWGCNDGPAPDTVPISAAWQAPVGPREANDLLVRAQSRWLRRCHPELTTVAEIAEWVFSSGLSVIDSNDLWPIAMGYAHIDEAAFQDCLRFYESGSCRQDPKAYCGLLVHGDIEAGQPCVFDAQCRSHLCVTTYDQTTCSAHCAPVGREGEGCSASEPPCGHGLVCRDGLCRSDPSLPDVWESCEDSFLCVPGAKCASGAFGDDPWAHNTCIPMDFQLACDDRDGDCPINEVCADGWCRPLVLAQWVGAPCQTVGEDGAYYACDASRGLTCSAEQDGLCRRTHEEGDPCEPGPQYTLAVWWECRWPAFCHPDTHRCVTGPLPAGAPCLQDRNCECGHCDWPSGDNVYGRCGLIAPRHHCDQDFQ